LVAAERKNVATANVAIDHLRMGRNPLIVFEAVKRWDSPEGLRGDANSPDYLREIPNDNQTLLLIKGSLGH
jgi:hypothetical protein